MRTKVLLCAAALAAGALSAVAQSNVYSLNVVGYINLPLVDGFNLVANQLDLDGYGTNNTVVTVFSTNLPVNTAVYTWDPVAVNYNLAQYGVIKGQLKWSQNISLNPGQGAWVGIPANSYGAGNTGMVTTVGTVLQGNLSNGYLPPGAGYALIGSQIPLAGGLQATLGYQPHTNDVVYTWDPVAVNYSVSQYGVIKGQLTWSHGDPQLAVGQGFWLGAAQATTWTTNFTVQ